MMEAVEFIHSEGWDAPPTLFGLVPAELIEQHIPEEDTSPLALVVQDGLPTHISGGSEELGDYLSRITWPQEIVGAVLAQEIMFKDAASDAPTAREARLFSGVLREGAELTLLQLKPTEEELDAAGAFADDNIELRGGPGIAPGVIAALRATLD
ncbi:PPA1309 family protein [Corynebacterium kozikiae]|uniref:PPA1309 family protein n=1 Tax=Corynebacterium kozikiae TaxID=2968469 RepID=UPI00211CD320|nr:PPA1309 family protein [Corynebacterium sp. 76QC2CO]MCQ9343070.1 PPA1309 family protein [Corynebacterium sp. 76QC2CO]